MYPARHCGRQRPLSIIKSTHAERASHVVPIWGHSSIGEKLYVKGRRRRRQQRIPYFSRSQASVIQKIKALASRRSIGFFGGSVDMRPWRESRPADSGWLAVCLKFLMVSLLGACPNICSCSRMAAGFRWALAFSASA